MTVPFMYNFHGLSNKFSTIFWRLYFFHTSHPRLDNFFVGKRKSTIYEFKNVMERGIKKNSTFAMRNFVKNIRENNTEALAISKRLKFPKDDRTYANCIAQLRMHLWRPKSTLDSLKTCCQCIWVETVTVTESFKVNVCRRFFFFPRI